MTFFDDSVDSDWVIDYNVDVVAAMVHNATMLLCLSVTYVYCVITSKHVLELFLPSLDLPFYHTLWQYSNGDPLTGAKVTILTNI